MTSTQTSHNPSTVTTKLFLGVKITSELRMHLNTSISWKHALLVKETSTPSLIIVRYQGDDYVGNYLPGTWPTLSDLRSREAFILNELALFCPKYETSKTESFAFPQVLIA